MTRSSRIALGFAMTLLLASTGCSERKDAPSVLLERGHLLQQEGKFADAVAAYSRAIEQEQTDANLYFNRGVAYGRLEATDKAIADYTEAIRLRPDFAQALNNRGVQRAAKGDHRQALDDYTEAIRFMPNDPLAWRNRGLAHHDISELDKALEDYNESIRLDGKVAESYFKRGNVFMQLKRYDRAAEDFTTAIRLDERLAQAWANRAAAKVYLGEAEPGQVDFEEAKRLDPQSKLPAEVERLLAQTLKEGGGKPATNGRSATMGREQQAFAAAQAQFESLGLGVVKHPLGLECAKGEVRFVAFVRPVGASADEKISVSAAELQQAQSSPVPVHLVVVRFIRSPDGRETPSVSTPDPDWLKDTTRLVPTAYEFRPQQGRSP